MAKKATPKQPAAPKAEVKTEAANLAETMDQNATTNAPQPEGGSAQPEADASAMPPPAGDDAGGAEGNAGEPVVVALLVTAKRDGFRRAGRAWSKDETRVEAADLTDDQVVALFAEPMLDVVGVADEVAQQ